MEGSTSLFLILLLVAVYLLFTGIKIVEETERLALFIGGRFAKLKGPGILLSPPSPGMKRLFRIKLGAVGIYLGSDTARFDSLDLPIVSVTQLRLNDTVQISGFEKNRLKVDKIEKPVQVFKCEKCGHINSIAA